MFIHSVIDALSLEILVALTYGRAHADVFSFFFFCFESFPDEANVQPEWSLFQTLRIKKTMCHDKTFRTMKATVRKLLLLISGTKHFYWNIVFVIQIPITTKKILSGTLLYVR